MRFQDYDEKQSDCVTVHDTPNDVLNLSAHRNIEGGNAADVSNRHEERGRAVFASMRKRYEAVSEKHGRIAARSLFVLLGLGWYSLFLAVCHIIVFMASVMVGLPIVVFWSDNALIGPWLEFSRVLTVAAIGFPAVIVFLFLVLGLSLLAKLRSVASVYAFFLVITFWPLGMSYLFISPGMRAAASELVAAGYGFSGTSRQLDERPDESKSVVPRVSEID